MLNRKIFGFVGLTYAAVLSLPDGVVSVQAGDSESDNPVVVELFTSQGCYSCPPAEAYLGELARRDDIIALEFHVDYWDYIGWKDPFATPGFTQRQRDYVRQLGGRYVYTPQMVIGGRADEVGSKKAAVAARIDAVAMAQAKDGPKIAIEPLVDGAQGLSIHIKGGVAPDTPLDVVMIGFDGRNETAVPRGENAGKSLVNTHTVRALKVIGRWDGTSFEHKVPAEDLAGNGGCAILVQAPNTGPIVAAKMMRF